MSQPPVLPVPPDLAARYGRTPEGRAWLASLPGIAHSLLLRWRLVPGPGPGAAPLTGHGAIVIPVVREDGSPAALKIAFPHDEARVERHALELWNGRGAVALAAADAGTCSLLLERLDAGRPLSRVPMADAVDVWGGLVRRLSLVPDNRPRWREFEHIAARAEQWSDDLPADWELLGRPFPRWLLEAALEVCQTRGAVGRRAARDVLVHTDLHYLNILARPGARATDGRAGPDGFAAIGPRPMIGEPEFAVAPVLWNRLRDLPLNQPESGLRERCGDFSAAAGLDPEAARQWAVAREVANALHYAGKPGHGGDLARSLWVASTLAGRTLEGLPPAHALPEPAHAAGSS